MKDMKEKGSKFLKTYFILVIIYAIISLIDSFFITGTKETYGQIFNQINIVLWGTLLTLLWLGIFILSIIAIVIFIKNKFSKITLVVPVFIIVTTIITFIYAIILGVIIAIQEREITQEPISKILIFASILTSLFELIFSVYVLNKFR